MSDADESHNSYQETRRAFDGLDVEERARFLVEATASTLARGLLQAGETLAEGVEEAIRRGRRHSSTRSRPGGPGAAEPQTSQRQASDDGPPPSEE
jgi:hypothetical protein